MKRYGRTKILLFVLVASVSVFWLWRYMQPYMQRSKATENDIQIPRPAIVMDSFEIDRQRGIRSFGEEIYDETRATINIAIGDLEYLVGRGEMTRARANELINEFKSEGKLYIERAQATYHGRKDPQTMVQYWSSLLDHYDGIFINEYTDSTALDGQSSDAIEALRLIKLRYPRKVIMPALVEAIGFSGTANPFYGGQVHSYRSFLQAVNQYADLVFYEFYLYTGQDEYAFVDSTKNAFNATVPGILSKTIYALYIPQTLDTILDDKGVDAHPDKSVGYHFQRQYELINEKLPDIAGVGFWVFYRSSPHVMRTVNYLTNNCYRTHAARCGDLPVGNLLQNGSFEQGGGNSLGAWQSNSVQQINYTAVPICNDLMLYSTQVWCRYLHLWNNGIVLEQGRYISQTVPVEGGKSYYLKGFFRARDPGEAQLTFSVRFSSASLLAYTPPPVVNDPSGASNQWRMRHVWFTVPQGVSSATIRIENGSSIPLYIDGVKLEKTLYAFNGTPPTTTPTSVQPTNTPIILPTERPTDIPTTVPSLTPTSRPTNTPIPPTVTSAPTPTTVPTSVVATIILSPTPAGCPGKNEGDADCDGSINLTDYEIWRGEYLGEDTTLHSDFDDDGRVTLTDYEIWRGAYLR